MMSGKLCRHVIAVENNMKDILSRKSLDLFSKRDGIPPWTYNSHCVASSFIPPRYQCTAKSSLQDPLHPSIFSNSSSIMQYDTFMTEPK